MKSITGFSHHTWSSGKRQACYRKSHVLEPGGGGCCQLNRSEDVIRNLDDGLFYTRSVLRCLYPVRSTHVHIGIVRL